MAIPSPVNSADLGSESAVSETHKPGLNRIATNKDSEKLKDSKDSWASNNSYGLKDSATSDDPNQLNNSQTSKSPHTSKSTKEATSKDPVFRRVSSARLINLSLDYVSDPSERNLKSLINGCDKFYGFENIELTIVSPNADTTSKSSHYMSSSMLEPTSSPSLKIPLPPKAPSIYFKRSGDKNANRFLTPYHPKNNVPIGLGDLLNIFDYGTIPHLYETTQTLSYPFTHTGLKLNHLDHFLQNCDYNEVQKVGHVFRAFCHEIGSISDPKYQTLLVQVIKRGLERLDKFFLRVENSGEVQLSPLHAVFMKLCSDGGYYFFATKYLENQFMLPSTSFGTNYATLFIYYYHASILLFDAKDFNKACEFATTALVACPWMKSDVVFSRYLITLLVSTNNGSGLKLESCRATSDNPNNVTLPTSHMSAEQCVSALTYFTSTHEYAGLYGSAAAPKNMVSKEVFEQCSGSNPMFSEPVVKATRSKSKVNKAEVASALASVTAAIASTVGPSSAGTTGSIIPGSFAESNNFVIEESQPIASTSHPDSNINNSALGFLSELNANMPLFSTYQLNSELYTFVTKHRELYFRNLPEYYLSVDSQTITKADKCRDYLQNVFEVDQTKVKSYASYLQTENMTAATATTNSGTGVTGSVMPGSFGNLNSNPRGENPNNAVATPVDSVREKSTVAIKPKLKKTEFDSETSEQLTQEFVYELVMNNVLCGNIEEEPAVDSTKAGKHTIKTEIDDSEDAVMKNTSEATNYDNKSSSSDSIPSYWITFTQNQFLDSKTGKKLTLDEQLEDLQNKLEQVGCTETKVQKLISEPGLPNRKNTILGALGLDGVRPEIFFSAATRPRSNIIHLRSEYLRRNANSGGELRGMETIPGLRGRGSASSRYDDGDSFMENSEESSRTYDKLLPLLIPLRRPDVAGDVPNFDFNMPYLEYQGAGPGGSRSKGNANNIPRVAQIAARRAGELLNYELRDYYFNYYCGEGLKLAKGPGKNGHFYRRGAKRVRSKSGGSVSQDDGPVRGSGVGRRRSYKRVSNEDDDDDEEEEEEEEGEEEEEEEEDEGFRMDDREMRDDDDEDDYGDEAEYFDEDDHEEYHAKIPKASLRNLGSSIATRLRTRAQTLASESSSIAGRRERRTKHEAPDDDRMDISDPDGGIATEEDEDEDEEDNGDEAIIVD